MKGVALLFEFVNDGAFSRIGYFRIMSIIQEVPQNCGTGRVKIK
jgi:hypothetical protein